MVVVAIVGVTSIGCLKHCPQEPLSPLDWFRNTDADALLAILVAAAVVAKVVLTTNCDNVVASGDRSGKSPM